MLLLILFFFPKHDYCTLQDQKTICILFPNTNLGYIDVYLNDLTYSIFTILLLFFSFVFSPLHPVALIALFLTICIIHQLLMWFFFHMVHCGFRSNITIPYYLNLYFPKLIFYAWLSALFSWTYILPSYWFDPNNYLCPIVQIFKSVSFPWGFSVCFLLFCFIHSFFFNFFFSLVRFKQDKSNSIPVIRQSLYFSSRSDHFFTYVTVDFCFQNLPLEDRSAISSQFPVPRKCITSPPCCTEVQSYKHTENPSVEE